MFNSSDVQTVFSGNIAEEWERKSQYIMSIEGNDNMMLPTIKKHLTPLANVLEIGCGTGKLLSQIDSMVSDIALTGIEMSRDMISQIDKSKFQNQVQLINSSIEDFTTNETYDMIVMKQVFHHIVSRKNVLQKLGNNLKEGGVIIIMTPNEGYQKSILPFNNNEDLLGRISDSMINEYTRELPLQVEEIEHVNTVAKFSSLYEYFMFLYSIGSLQKIFNYKGEYEYALKLISIYRNLFSKEENLLVDFDYSYITLKKVEM
ncbi:demethylrebeccamycin-D-glucose O-methyltransferase [Lachnospiraceae bacterium]|nr:demethylrebeccamycin-D-glucose O-methyltransferase [Lachnospiraceae bacterium]